MEDLVNLCPQDEARVQAIHKEIDIFDCLATSYLDREYLKILKETAVVMIKYLFSQMIVAILLLIGVLPIFIA